MKTYFSRITNTTRKSGKGDPIAKVVGVSRSRAKPPSVEIPTGESTIELRAGGRLVTLTNLQKVFWPEDRITKHDLLQYYADISPYLLPHLADRAMVMKRYPDGAYGKFFFQNYFLFLQLALIVTSY